MPSVGGGRVEVSERTSRRRAGRHPRRIRVVRARPSAGAELTQEIRCHRGFKVAAGQGAVPLHTLDCRIHDAAVGEYHDPTLALLRPLDQEKERDDAAQRADKDDTEGDNRLLGRRAHQAQDEAERRALQIRNDKFFRGGALVHGERGQRVLARSHRNDVIRDHGLVEHARVDVVGHLLYALELDMVFRRLARQDRLGQLSLGRGGGGEGGAWGRADIGMGLTLQARMAF